MSQTEIEAIAAELWSNILGVDGVEPSSNFFELGGNSMSALRLINGIQERSGLTVPLASMFENPTFGGLVSCLVAAARETRDEPKSQITANELEW